MRLELHVFVSFCRVLVLSSLSFVIMGGLCAKRTEKFEEFGEDPEFEEDPPVIEKENETLKLREIYVIDEIFHVYRTCSDMKNPQAYKCEDDQFRI